MNMPRLLIADHSDEVRQSLAQSLSQHAMIYTCSSGDQALELMLRIKPDIVVMDVMLPQIDGISLLNRAAQAGVHPAVLVTSCYFSPYTLHSLGKLGVEYIMNKPCDPDAVAGHVADMAASLTPAEPDCADMEAAGTSLLLRMGFSSKLDGFRYLQAALPIYCGDSTQAITKELYAAVGKVYNKSSKQIERSIRNAIERAWKVRDDQLWREFFPTPPNCPVPRPSNGSFISRIAGYLACQLADVRVI